MIFTINGGHNPDGKTACGAVGLIKESTANRDVVKEMIKLLESKGHTAYDTTVNDGISQADIIHKIVAKANSHKADLHVSIHFNAGADDEKGNGRTTGTEVIIYKTGTIAEEKANAIAKNISSQLGLANRGVKINQKLGFLRDSKGPALLVECCFVDDKDDVAKYTPQKMAKAIVEGLIGQVVVIEDKPKVNPPKAARTYPNGSYEKRMGKVVGTGTLGLNVRELRDSKSKEVANLKEGSIVNLNFCLNNWFSTYDIKNGSKPCYVNGAYIELV